MSREEAIDILESRSVCMECVISKYDCDACDEAFKMAISALEKADIYDDGEHYVTISKALYDRLNVDTCEDAISREAVEKIVNKYIDGSFRWGAMLIEIKRLPSVQANRKGHWIDVNKRLPEDGENVMFSTKTDRVFEGRYFADNTEQQWYAFRDETFAWNNVVTAWMPLPEPYKADMREKEKNNV